MDINNMQDIVKIKCPNCGVQLTVKYFEGIEAKTVTCPVCKKANLFSNYKKVVPNNKPQSQTEDDATRPAYTMRKDEKTTPGQTPTGGIGRLIMEDTGKSYQLTPGLNIVGRKAQTSTANIQLDTDDRTMSRSHCAIEVKKLSNGSYIHYLSNAKNKNATYINGQQLEDGDRIVLQGGEKIQMGDSNVKFMKAKACDDTETLI